MNEIKYLQINKKYIHFYIKDTIYEFNLCDDIDEDNYYLVLKESLYCLGKYSKNKGLQIFIDDKYILESLKNYLFDFLVEYKKI